MGEKNWIFVFRLHDSVVQKINVNGDNIFSGNIGDDMAEYLLIADALLTDYSSCFFDYALTKQPCFLYCPDFEHYARVERGLYYKMEDLPCQFSKTTDELYECIEKFDIEGFQDKVTLFLEKKGNVEDGCSTE